VGITGAGGFIGHHLVATIAGAGHEVLAFVRRHPPPPGVPCRTIDLVRPQDLDETLRGLDALIHAAAHVPASYLDPGEARACFEVNTLATLELLRAAERVSLGKFVLFSSGNIYRVGPVPVAENGPVEPSPRAPYYLASKACADLFAEQFRRETRVPVVTLRPSAVYGPGLRRGLIAVLLERLSKREVVTIDDGGRYRADMVSVTDVANAALAALERPVQGPFNVGSGTATGPLEVGETLARLVGASPALLQVQPPRGERPEGFAPLAIDRARRELDYSPRPLEKGLAEYVAWWRATTTAGADIGDVSGPDAQGR
jgi:UDP-glucose 4-epimerase